MKFITALFTLYRNGEFLQFMKNLLSIFNKFDVEALKLTERVSKLSGLTDELDSVFKPLQGEELTGELKTLDTRRDKALMGIKQYLISQTYREEEDVLSAAEALLANYRSHSERIDKLPYQLETAVTNAMLHDWETQPNLLAAVTKLSLNDWSNLLKTLNQTFNTTYVERAEATPEPAEIKDKRDIIREAYNQLTEDTEAHSRISENKETYITIIKEVNALIDDYNSTAKKRLKGNSGEE